MPVRFASTVLVVSCSFAFAAACGAPPAPETPPPSASPPAPAASASPGAAVPPEGTPAAPGTPPGSTASPTSASPLGPAVTATAMAGELSAMGLDATKLPRLERLKGDQLRKVMKLFTKSLGVQCSFCHKEDFAAPTPHKRVAEGMWNELVRGMAFQNGDPVFCDSCHAGKAEILDRRDKQALGHWMQENYVKPMKLAASGAEMTCGACHGDPFVPAFVHEWEAGRRKPQGPASFGR